MSHIQEYLESIKSRSVCVIGMGVSNTPLIMLLLRADINVTVRDQSDRERVEELAAELESLGATLILGPDYLENLNEDIIFRTPGLNPNTPELMVAKNKGSELTSEMELFFRTCPCTIIGITGSDGKTTTTTIIAKFLKQAGYNVYVGGNIGKPLLADVEGMVEEDYVVLELSSFQLMTLEQSPHIAVFTNLTPNHLDYHGSMEDYIEAKEHIFAYQSQGDQAIFNYDNEVTCDLAQKAVGQVTFFSARERLEQGVYLRDGAIWLTNRQGSREVLPLKDILLPGRHNVENYMAAIAAVDELVPDSCVREVAKKFAGVEHRIELVREINGIKFYNDSIGTSPTRTAACLSVFDRKVILIAGGYDKGVSFTGLGMEITEHVKALVLTGNTAQAINSAVKSAPTYAQDQPTIVIKEQFEDAVQAAFRLAQPGDIVVLSPACAAFDQFKNFMHRGEVFKSLVNALEV